MNITMRSLLLVAVALTALGCDPDYAPFVCHEDDNCSFERGGDTGHCWPAPTGYDTCAYLDPVCPSGWRWDDLGELTDCVAPDNVCPQTEPNACN